MFKRLFTILFIISLLTNTFAQDKKEKGSEGKFSGYMFGDYYYFIDNHKPELKDQRGFWFRRIYFTYDYKINKDFSTRLRLEMSNEFNFEKAKTIVPFIKDAWLKYKFSKQAVILGIQPTPTWEKLEKIWGYRLLEKTPLDLQKFGSSRDFGVAMKGKLDKKGIFEYHVMFGNGSSNKQEIDKGKSGMLAVSFNLTKSVLFQVYGDYADNEGEADWYTLQGFFGYKIDRFSLGMLYAFQNRKNNAGETTGMNVASIFASGAVSENFTLIGRVDRKFEPNPDGDRIPFIPFDPTAPYTFFILAVDWHPVKEVKMIPNIEYTAYSENDRGFTPTDDIIGRITFYWEF